MKFFVTIIFFALVLLASDKTNHLQIQVLEKILSKININKEMKIYSDNQNILSELQEHTELIIVNSYDDATLLILENKKNIYKPYSDKAIFVLKYSL